MVDVLLMTICCARCRPKPACCWWRRGSVAVRGAGHGAGHLIESGVVRSSADGSFRQAAHSRIITTQHRSMRLLPELGGKHPGSISHFIERRNGADCPDAGRDGEDAHPGQVPV